MKDRSTLRKYNLEEGNLFIDGEITAESFRKFRDQALYVHSLTKSCISKPDHLPLPCVEIWIDSGGGDFYYGLAMYDLIYRLFPSVEVTTSVVGRCNSAAVFPFLAGTWRWVSPYSTFMIHDTFIVPKDGCGVTENDIESLKSDRKMEDKIFERETSLTAKKLRSMIKKEGDWYLTRKELNKYGFIQLCSMGKEEEEEYECW